MQSEGGIISPRNNHLLGNGMDSARSLKGKQQVLLSDKKVNKEVDEKTKMLKKKQQNYIEGWLQSIRRMVNTPVFIGNYYNTKNGATFAKVIQI
jgi:ribosomal protein S19